MTRNCPNCNRPFPPRGPCRHCALKAKPAPIPVSDPVESVVDPVEIPAAKKRGRPAANGVAMTAAERKAKSRAKQQAKLDDAERRKLIAELMRIYRRQESEIIDDPKRKQIVTQRRESAHAQSRIYLSELNRLSLAQLQIAIAGKKTPDSHGRLHNERSGESRQKFGQSEIERIFGARQHDTSFFDSDEDQDRNLAGGFKVKPEGTGPEHDQDSTVDDADNVRQGLVRPRGFTEDERKRDRKIQVIIGKMVLNPETGTAKCPFCFEHFMIELSAENHLTEQYVKGEKDAENHREFKYGIAMMNSKLPPGMDLIPVELEPRTVPYLHYKGIWETAATKARR